MVIAKMFGGLGNQMFIYAAARSLALRLNTELFLDTTSGFLNDPYKRQFELDRFNAVYKKASSLQSFQFPMGRYIQSVLRSNQYLNAVLPFKYVYEKDSTSFHSSYFDIDMGKSIYLEGYWQCSKYFEQHQSTVLNDFMLLYPLSGASLKVEKKILQESNAVCLHARRMYKAPNDCNAKVDPDDYERSIPASYYQKGVKQILETFPNAHFFCFGDYPDWFRENISINEDQITIVNHNQYHMNLGYEDLWLMSNCKHYIISNSTFSWWAAWLSKFHNQKRMVISPPKRFWDNKDIIPENWSVCNE